MKKKIRTLLVVMLIVSLFNIPAKASSFEELPIQDFFLADEQNSEYIERQEKAHLMAECARALGYSEDSEIIQIAKLEWDNAEALKRLNTFVPDCWLNRYYEYPTATYVWLYLTKGLGYSDAVAAGIVGNMMTEVGGGTLDLKYQAYSKGRYFYGLCQWNRKVYPDIQGADLIEQCNFLAETIEYELNTFGYAYSRGYRYMDFLELSTSSEAALMFAKSYERCGSGSYYSRQSCANTAYDYFTGLS